MMGKTRKLTSIKTLKRLVINMIQYSFLSCCKSDKQILPDQLNLTTQIFKETRSKRLIIIQSTIRIRMFIFRKSQIQSLQEKMFTNKMPADWFTILTIQQTFRNFMKFIYHMAKREIQIELVSPLQYSLHIQRKRVCTTKPGSMSILVYEREQALISMEEQSLSIITKKQTLMPQHSCEAKTKAQKVIRMQIRAILACCLYFLISLILSNVTVKMHMTTAKKKTAMTASGRFFTSQQQKESPISAMNQYYCRMELQHSQQSTSQDVLQDYYDLDDSQMLKLEIKTSNLPGSGMGLFASQLIKQYEIIAEYYGSLMRTKNSNDNQFAHQDKMVEIDKEVCVISRGPASRANDIVKWEPDNYNSVLFKMLRQKSMFPTHNQYKINARIAIQPKQKAFLKATRPIQAGEEIFIQYGFDYWNFFYKEHLGLNQA